MISLGRKDNWWGVVMDYNDDFLLAIYVLLMLYYVYIIVIYNDVCVKNLLFVFCLYTVWRRISNTHENMTNIMATGFGGVHEDGYKDLMEEDGTYGASGVLWGYLLGVVVEVVLVRWMGYEYGTKCESRCLFSCLYLDKISYLFFVKQDVL